MRCTDCIKGCLKFSNHVLLLIGLAMSAYTIFMYAEIVKNSHSDEPSSTPPPAYPAPETFSPTTESQAPTTGPSFSPTSESQGASSFSPTTSLSFNTEDISTKKTEISYAYLPSVDSSVSESYGSGNVNITEFKLNVSKYWFVYAFGASGVFTTITAVTGIAAAGTHSGCLLNCYTYELVLMLLGQTTLALALITKTGLQRIPQDSTGHEQQIHKWVHMHFDIVKWIALGVLILELESALLACMLKSVSPVLESDDEEDEPARPLLSQSEASDSSGPAGSHRARLSGGQRERGDGRTFSHRTQTASSLKFNQWCERMRDKYGLDTDRLTYDPETNRGESAYAGSNLSTTPSSASKCIIA